MLIALDLDSVLNNLDEEWVKWANEHHDPDFRIDDWKSWNLHEHCKGGSKVYEFLNTRGTFSSLQPREGAQEVVEKLVKVGHTVIVVTACVVNSQRSFVMGEKADWLRKHFPMIPDKHLIFASQKQYVYAEMLIDDAPHNIMDYRTLHGAAKPVVFDRPWNRIPEMIRFDRMSGWKDAPRFFHRRQIAPFG